MPNPREAMITSAANPIVKRIRALADRKHRRREGAFVVEGLQPVWRAVAARAVIELLVVAPELLANPAAIEMVDEQEQAGVRVARVSAEVFRRLSDRDGPTGLVAIVRGSVAGLDRLAPRTPGVFVALYEAGNPGNIGTVIRTADAVGAAGVILIGDTADPLAASAVKASMGSVFALPLAHADSIEELFAWAQAGGLDVLAATGSAERAHWDLAYPPGLVLLLGSEGNGLAAEVIAECAASVRIPMQGTAESLNLAVAASVLLYEVKRARLAVLK